MLNLKTKNKEEVYYWPLWFSKSLSASEQIKIEKIIKKVQSAQIFLWQAFNIYDDFLDNEAEACELPKANNYFRHYLKIHYELRLATDYYKLLEKIFNNLSTANQKELIQKKLQIKKGLILIPKKMPKINPVISLADKSLVLALGPIALLSFLGYKIKDKKVQSTLNFFKCALAAKQLADDSQDWLVDLQAGSLTRVNKQILSAAKKSGLSINLKTKLTVLYLLFVKEVAPKVISDLKILCRQAESFINQKNNKKETLIFNRLMGPIKVAYLKAEKFRTLVLEK